jgi:hypothetical protein
MHVTIQKINSQLIKTPGTVQLHNGIQSLDNVLYNVIAQLFTHINNLSYFPYNIIQYKQLMLPIDTVDQSQQ